MSKKSDPFIGPTWSKLLLGWVLFGLGGLMTLLLVGVLVVVILFGFGGGTELWAGAAFIAFWAFALGMGAVAGWRILRAPALPAEGIGPRGSVWIILAGLLMIPLLWLVSRLFLGPGPLDGSGAYVALVCGVLVLLTFPALKRFQALRGSPIRWWEWGLVEGLLAGGAGGLQILLAGRGVWLSWTGGLVTGSLFFASVGGYFLWWERVARGWHIQQGGRLAWPFS